MEDEFILSEKDRSKLDGIVSKMVNNNEVDENIKFVVNDFKSKYGVKKKESSEVSPSKPSAKPSASVTSPSFAPKGQPTQAVPAAFGEIPKYEATQEVAKPSDYDTPNWYNVAKSALGQTYEIGKSALLKAASYTSPLSTPLTREVIDVQAKAAVNKLRDEGPKFEQTFTESIAQGKFGDAALQAEEFLLGTAPLAVTAAAISIGTGGAGTPAALALMGGYGAQSAHINAKGEKFYEEMSPLMRAGYTGAMGGLEILGEGIGGKILSKAAMKFAAQELSKEAFDQTAKEIVKGALKSNGVAITEDSLAEFTTGFGQSAVDQYARTGAIDLKEALRQGGEGAAMGVVGGAVFNTPSTIADATALANSVGRDMKNAKARTEINKYKEKLDASSTVEEQDYYAQKLAESIKTRTRNATDDAKFYEYVGTQNPQDLEQFLEIDNEIKRYASMAKVIKDPEATKDIKAKVEGLIQQQKDLESKYSAYDTQKEAGIPSPVVEGEAPIEVQPIKGAGQEAPEAGGVLQVPIEEGAEVTAPAEVVAPIEATVFAAPFYDTKVNNIEEARAIRQTEAYVTNLDTIRNASAFFNLEIDGIDESIGGFVNEAGDKIVEVSNIIRVKGTPEDVQNYAAFLATSSPETQEATIAATYVEQNSEMHNIDELTISVSDIDGAIEALKENDIYDFTINDSNNTITFLDFSKGEDVEFKKKIGRFAKSLDAKNITNEEQDIRAIDSKYIGPSERTRILGQVQETLVQQGQTGTELYRQVEQAIARNQEFLAKAEAPITEAEPESIIEPVSDSEAANFVKPEPGKSLDDIYRSYEESIKPVITPKTVLQSVKKKTIDRQSKLKNAVLEIGLRNAYDRIVNKSGASARANDKYRRAEKKIYSKLSDEEIKTLDKIIFARRVIQIDQNFDARGDKRPKHPLGYSLEKANFNLAELKNKLGEEKYNDLIKRSDAYFEEFRSTLKDLYDAGLISEDTYENLRTNNYQPRKFIEHVYDFNNAKFLLKDNGLTDNQIKAIKEGSDKELIMNSRFLLSSYLLSASNRILSNRTNKALSEAIDKNKATKQWIRPLKEGDDVDSGFSKVLYLENGEQRQFQLRADLKSELDNVSLNLGDSANLISIALGVPLIKLMATGANPIFAVKNVFRDFGHVLFFTNVYDKHNLYYATALLIRDYQKGLKSSMRKDQDFIDYMDLGGGMSFLASQGRDGNFAKKTLKDKALDFLGKPGEYSEIAMRISVYRKFKDEGILKFEQKNGNKPTGEDLLNIKESAVAKAREIIDFQQGGELVKALDKFIPYLNAAFQGFRVGATYVANNPKTFANKFVQAQLGLLILSFFNSWASDDEDMQNIPEHTRLMNFIIFIPFSKRIDEDGVERKAFIKIPKTQQAAPFFALMDVVNRKIINDIFGKEYEVSQDEYSFIVNGLKKSLPIGLSSALGIVDIASRKAVGGAKDEKIENEAFRDLMQTVPLFNSVATYMSNYDAFRDRMIAIDKDKLSPSFEGVSDPDVEKFYKVIGETTGMSPIRTKAATEKLITGPQSSLVVGASYGLLDAMVNSYDLDKGEYNLDVIKSDNNNFFKSTGLSVKKSLIAETDPKWKLYSKKETLDNIDREAGTERARLRNKAKELSMRTNTPEQLEKSIEEARKIANEIAKKNPIDAKYFFNSFKANIGESPASPESIEIQYSASDKARAEKINFLYNPQSQEEFTQIMREVYQQTGYKISDKTIYEYQQEYGKLK
jgi:hypothetical protein